MKKFKDWLDEASASKSLKYANIFARYEASQAGRFGPELISMIDSCDYAGLLEYELDYKSGASVGEYLHARQCLGFFVKNPALAGLIPGYENLESLAFEKFLGTERQCAKTNAVFGSYLRGNTCIPDDIHRVIHAARWKIDKVLGAVPKFSTLAPKLGPGASTTVRKMRACAAEKLAGPLACSINTAPWLPLIFGQHPHLFAHHSVHRVEGEDDVWTVDVLEHNGKLQFVPKDVKSKRTIVVEPSLTSYYQLGIGEIMADRLRVNGVDINNQTTNQNLARYGSVSGAVATLDLRSASDSVATDLVRCLLPEGWFKLLDGFRCPAVDYKGSTIQLEKFSSMGNGFTFPLETLIFYALVWAASPYHERGFINAYGDDIVCGADSAPFVKRVLEFCGFSINEEKSFVDGPFRESCGADYFRGINIRPFRLKKLVSPEVLFSVHNWYFRQYDAEGVSLALALIPNELKLWGPEGYGDGHLLCEQPELRIHKRCHGWGGYLFDTYTTKPKRTIRVHPGDYLQVLYSVYARGTGPEGGPVENRGEGAMKIAPEPGSGSDGEVVKTMPSTGKRHYRRISIYTLSSR